MKKALEKRVCNHLICLLVFCFEILGYKIHCHSKLRNLHSTMYLLQFASCKRKYIISLTEMLAVPLIELSEE